MSEVMGLVGLSSHLLKVRGVVEHRHTLGEAMSLWGIAGLGGGGGRRVSHSQKAAQVHLTVAIQSPIVRIGELVVGQVEIALGVCL
jgi:hypothetical protein